MPTNQPEPQNPISGHPCRSVAKLSRRGGRRPGAGAPRGNMNALKTGAYSKQFALLGRLLAADPKVRDTLLAIGARADLKIKKGNEIAAFLLARYIKRVENIAAGSGDEAADRLILGLPTADLDSIKEAAARYEQKMQK